MRFTCQPIVMALAAAALALAAAPADAQPRAGGRLPAHTSILDSAARAIEQQPPAAPAAPKRDSVLNGVLIGAGIGAALGLIPDYYDDCEECHDSLYWSIAVGAGVGLVVDLLRNPRPVPPGGTDQAFSVGPVASRRTLGVSAAVRWR